MWSWETGIAKDVPLAIGLFNWINDGATHWDKEILEEDQDYGGKKFPFKFCAY